MSNDHFVAQTYLKHFGDGRLNGRLHAYSKSGKSFEPRTRDVCAEWDGDLNPRFIPHYPDLLGDLRKISEPRWNQSLENFVKRSATNEDKLFVSLYMSNLLTCTPAWRRVAVKMFDQALTARISFGKRMHEKHGRFPELPAEIVEKIERGEIVPNHDPDFIKAMATLDSLTGAWQTYNQDWTILSNDTEHPFITSDNPVCFDDRRTIADPFQRYLTLTPGTSIAYSRRMAQLNVMKPSIDFQKPSRGTINYSKATPRLAREINRQVAMCAEEMVFSSIASPPIQALVMKYAKFRVDGDFVNVPAAGEDASYLGFVVQVRALT